MHVAILTGFFFIVRCLDTQLIFAVNELRIDSILGEFLHGFFKDCYSCRVCICSQALFLLGLGRKEFMIRDIKNITNHMFAGSVCVHGLYIIRFIFCF